MILVLKGVVDDAQIRTREQGAPDQPTLSVTTGSGTTDLISDADTELRQSNPTTNYGTATTMGIIVAADEMRGIVQWDLSAYQPDVTVTAAKMRFNVNTANANLLVSVYEALQSWTEGVGTNGSDADWLRHDTGQTWANPGGDFSSTVLGSFTPSATGWVEIENASIIALVQGWLDGSIDNNGVFLTGSGTASQEVQFASSSTVDNPLSPQLTFTFNTNSRETHMTVSPSLVSDGGTIQVSMELSATQTITDVTPSLNVVGTNGVTATCGSPTPTPPIDVVANTPTTFSWVCTAHANGAIGDVLFEGSGTGALGAVFATAASNSVLVAPPLTFQVAVDNPATVDPVVNSAWIKSASIIPPTESDPVETAIGASIGDYVWADLDGDGVQDAGEPPLSGVEVCAYDWRHPDRLRHHRRQRRIPHLRPGHTTTTPSNSPWPPCPTDYLPTTPTSLTVTSTAPARLSPSTTRTPTSALHRPARPASATPSGSTPTKMAWSIPPKPCCPASPSNSTTAPARSLLVTTTTDANGIYTFTGLYAGDYVVQVDETSPVDSPYDGMTTLAAAMEIVDGGSNPAGRQRAHRHQRRDDADFPYNWTGSIGDYVWYDTNYNGVQDESPVTPIAGATVLLYHDANNNGIIDGLEWDVIGVAITDANGAYTFDNLPPGNYLVDVYEDSITNDGVRDIVPTTPNVLDVTLAPGEDYVTADFGYYQGALVEGHVFWDERSQRPAGCWAKRTGTAGEHPGHGHLRGR